MTATSRNGSHFTAELGKLLMHIDMQEVATCKRAFPPNYTDIHTWLPNTTVTTGNGSKLIADNMGVCSFSWSLSRSLFDYPGFPQQK